MITGMAHRASSSHTIGNISAPRESMNFDWRTALLTYWKVIARKKNEKRSAAMPPSPGCTSTPSKFSVLRQRDSPKSAVVED